MATNQGLYEVLGTSEISSANEIKMAYRKRARETHPDRNPGKPPGEFQKVQEARETLSDEVKRATYDTKLRKESQDHPKHYHRSKSSGRPNSSDRSNQFDRSLERDRRRSRKSKPRDHKDPYFDAEFDYPYSFSSRTMRDDLLGAGYRTYGDHIPHFTPRFSRFDTFDTYRTRRPFGTEPTESYNPTYPVPPSMHHPSGFDSYDSYKTSKPFGPKLTSSYRAYAVPPLTDLPLRHIPSNHIRTEVRYTGEDGEPFNSRSYYDFEWVSNSQTGAW